MRFERELLILKDGTRISSEYSQDCCEYNVADFTALKDTTFEDENITKGNLQLELVEGYGFRINGYFVPCYSYQNGYYGSEMDILVDGVRVLTVDGQIEW